MAKGFVDYINEARETFASIQKVLKKIFEMNNHKISGFANPTENNDAVQKFYVDKSVRNLHQELENLQTRVTRLERLANPHSPTN